MNRLRRVPAIVKGDRFTPVRRLRRERQCTVLKFPSAAAIAGELKRRGVPHATKTTVTRDLKVLGCVSRVRRVGPVMTEKAMKRRVAFAKEWLANPVKFAFSDETTVCGNTSHTFHRRQWVHKPTNERPLPRLSEKTPNKVSVWMSFTNKDRAIRILRCPPTVTEERHVNEVLEPSLDYFRKVHKKGYTIQEDNAPTHDLSWYQKKKLRHLATWPATSPDMNPTEQLNAMLKARVGHRAPWGVEELEAVILEEFHAIPQQTLDKLCKSFAKRAEKVVASGGATIKP